MVWRLVGRGAISLRDRRPEPKFRGVAAGLLTAREGGEGEKGKAHQTDRRGLWNENADGPVHWS